MLSFVLQLALAGFASEGLASSGPHASDVAWDAPQGCPSRSAVVSGVEVLLGEPLAAERLVVVLIEGRVEQLANEQWKLSLRISTEAGTRERTFVGTTCQELGEIAIVLIAVAIDPSVEMPEAELPSGEDESAAAGEATENQLVAADDGVESDAKHSSPIADVSRDRSEASQSSDAQGMGFVRVATGLLVGPLPAVGPGIHVDLGLRWRMLALSLGMSHWFERRVRIPGHTAGGDLQLTTGDVRICAVPSARRLDVPLCVGVELGAMAGRGVGVSNPRRGRGLWAAMLADVGITFRPWRWIGFGIRAGLVIPVTRPMFAFDDVGEVHRAAVVGFQGLAGIELRFP